MIPSTHGGFLSPEGSQRATVDFIPIKEKRRGNDQIMYCTIKQLVQSCKDVEEILNIDSIPLDIVGIVGRILDINWKVSRQMVGEIPYTELTLTDSTDMIFIQIYKNDDKDNLFDHFMRMNNLKGDPKQLLKNMYIRAFVSPKKNETEKKWKYNCRYIEQIYDFNIITYHFLKCITEHLERTVGVLSTETKESLYEQAQSKKINIQQQQLMQSQLNQDQAVDNNLLQDKEILDILDLPFIAEVEADQEEEKINQSLMNLIQDTKSEQMNTNTVNQMSQQSAEINISQLLKEENKNQINSQDQISDSILQLLNSSDSKPETSQNNTNIQNLVIEWIKQNSNQINQEQVINYFITKGIPKQSISLIIQQLCDQKLIIDTGSQYLYCE